MQLPQIYLCNCRKLIFKVKTSYCMICMVICSEILELRIVVSFLIINIVKIMLVIDLFIWQCDFCWFDIYFI